MVTGRATGAAQTTNDAGAGAGTTAYAASPALHRRTWLDALNGPHHELAGRVLLVVVLAHWAEHLAQAWQIYVIGMPVAQAGGVLGFWFPFLVHSEWLHYGYAIVMLAGLYLLRFGMQGRARLWWDIALWIQVWHHFEHLLLLLQSVFGSYLFGAAKPTSIAQLVIPRVELHLLYNAAVFVPMIIGMWFHLVPGNGKPHVGCSCALSWAVRPEPVPDAPAEAAVASGSRD